MYRLIRVFKSKYTMQGFSRYCTLVGQSVKEPNRLLTQIQGRIRFDGPMTVAQYMQEILTHPRKGYYMTRDVFGTSGDFTTSPEISQLFGECLAIWMFHEWKKMGSPLPLQIAELGPGRGTLMQDILRTFRAISPKTLEQTSVHLVEASPYLRQIQKTVLCGQTKDTRTKFISKFGPSIEWYQDVSQIPQGFTLFVANEFFDALPVHKFVRIKCQETGKMVWREVLVDIDEVGGETKLRWVRSRHKTPACHYLSEDGYKSHDSSAEISTKSGIIVKDISDKITQFGGTALIADYGHDGLPSHGDTLRAFKNHKLHDPLVEPGSADLTADVDFAYLKRHCGEDTLQYGPISQRQFLLQLGIELRMKKLCESNSTNEKTVKDIESGYQMLIDQMGERFKFFSIFPKTMSPIHNLYPPVGFN